MTTMNREEQKQVLIDTANHIINRDNTSPYSENLRELARIALASLEAEPVGAFHIAEQQVDGTSDYLKDGEWPIDNGIIEVYAAPPAPVSVPAAMEMDDDFDSAFEHGKAVGWNAYRAAMLQAEPVSNSDELPLDYLQGHKDGLEWAAQLAEANHPQTGDWLYDDPIDLARAIRKGPDMPTVQGGNSPVTPDAWISCSERMPEKLIPVMVMYEDGEMWSAMWNGNRLDDGTEYPDPHSVTHWREMPAAPQQEVK
ncbi:DUF551 domain-containing protein [Escherichia coli]|uniref:DUF551 domain-containing protein n=1 Tax=Escherichia coli TaxID=562 RepID=UPI003EE654D6